MIQLPGAAEDLSLLLLRIILAITFFVSSRNKRRDIHKFAKNNGLPVPAAYLVMVIELSASALMTLGVLAQFAAMAVMILMLGTIRLHIFKWKSPYWAAQGGWEYDLTLLAMASVIAVFGPGAYALFN